MTHDVHELLDEAAPVPDRAVDLGSVLGAARRRKRRGRAAGALAGVVVIAGAVFGAVAVTSGGGTTSLAVRAGSPASTTPDSWARVTADGKGVSLAVPPGWAQQPAGSAADELLVVGSTSRSDAGVIAACTAPAPTGTIGTWVSLYEFPAGSTSVSDPQGGTVSVQARPADFRNGLPASGSCGTTATTIAPSPSQFTNAFATIAFTDAGRVFLARVVTIGTTDQVPELRLGEEVLNTLHVDPAAADATTTTSGPDSSTTAPAGTDPGAVTTTLPPSAVGESADQLAVRTAFLGWLDSPTRDGVDQYVDDFASIVSAVREGMAQHTPQDLAGFSGRVESVVIADPTHADVVYTVLHDGAAQYANRPGKAVKVGGTWKVTRDTECALLAVGGVACPPRTTPVP